MRPLHFSLNLAFALSMTACSIYKSSDRDDFNDNGKARAPVAAAVLSTDDQRLLENPCDVFQNVSSEDLQSLFGQTRLSMSNEVTPKTSSCLIEAMNEEANAPERSVSDQNEGQNSERLQTPSFRHLTLLSCSWKPVDGRPIPSAPSDFISQTTEDELRSRGFGIVSTSVASGSTLRMNCEAYAPRSVIESDRDENDERARDEVASRFAVFAIGLNRETLISTGQK